MNEVAEKIKQVFKDIKESKFTMPIDGISEHLDSVTFYPDASFEQLPEDFKKLFEKLEQDVLKILEDYTIIEKQKLRELADLLKTWHSLSLSEFKGTKHQCLAQMRHIYTSRFQRMEKKFAELGLDTKKET